MIDTERTALPGIGIRHVMTTEAGQRVGVISYRSGRRDLLVYDPDDSDSVLDCVPLTVEEADAFADLLAASRIVERLADLQGQVDGIMTERIPVPAGSPYDNRTLGDTGARTRTGASIVAVVRHENVVTSPRPDFVFEADDVVLAVGTPEGTAALAAIFANG